MKPQSKAVFKIITISVFLLVILFYFTDKYFFNGYKNMEKKEIVSSVRIFKRLLDEYESLLNNSNKHWSSWDDTYEFAQNLNEDYIKKNIIKENFSNIKSNFMIFVNNKGKVIYSKGFDIYNGNFIDVPNGLVKYIESNPNMYKHTSINNYKSGFIVLDGKIMIISSMPIVKFKESSSINGSLVMARYITGNEVKAISEVVGEKTELRILDQVSLKKIISCETFTEKGERIYINSIDDNSISAFSIIKDIDGKPSFMITMKYARDIYTLSHKGKIIFSVSMIIIVLFFVVAILIVIDKYIFKVLNQQQSLLNTIPAGVFYKDKNMKYIIANKFFCDTMKIDMNSINEKNYCDLVGDSELAYKAKKADKEIKSTLGSVIGLESQYVNKNGDTRWMSTYKSPVLDSHGNFNGIVGVMFDVTYLKEMTEKLDFASYYDSITMLPNRNYFIKNLYEIIEKSKIEKSQFSILYIGIDNFARINETIGHLAGDELLRDMAKRISNSLSTHGIISRVGGDEYAVIIDEVDIDVINDCCSNLLKVIRMPWDYNGKSYHITASIGIVSYPQDGLNSEELLKNSHTTMHLSKFNGKNRFLYYSKKFSEYFIEKFNMENELRLALQKGEFVLYYQPQIDAKTKKIIGLEALIRWIHPEKGMLSPGVFIPIAEESGLIVPIGEWVIKESCRQIKEWINKGISGIKISINISAKQFEQENLVDIIKESISESEISPCLLEIEITESVVMKDKIKTIEKLNKIKEIGINILMDDFGTGYSSLLYLKSFPIDKVKIDQNFVKDMSKNKDYEAIVKTIILLARQLGIGTIAEGIEEEWEYNKLKEFGCDEMQGYFFGRPSAPDIIQKMIEEKEKYIDINAI